MQARDEIAQGWRDALLEVVSQMPDAPVLLSGGTDSAVILAALLALGRRPTCYCYQLGESPRSDHKVAESMARTFGLDFRSVKIPQNDITLLRDVREIITLLGTTRKSAVQCAHPIGYLASAISQDGHDHAYCGTGGVIEDNRSGALILHYEGEEAFRAYRAKNLTPGISQNGNGTWAMHRMAQIQGVTLLEPLVTDPLRSYALALDAAEINKPFQKGIAFRAFPEFWTRGKWRRQNSPLQVNGGIRDWHETLLAHPINRRNRRSIKSLYDDIKEFTHG